MIRVFVGCPANNEDLECQAVLEYTLRHYASEEISIEWMRLSRDPKSFWYSSPETGEGWQTRGWATPFSALRWGIPEFCGRQGRAIYVDSDVMVRADVGELWRQSMGTNYALAKDSVHFSVMLMDCEALANVLPPVADMRANSRLHEKVRGVLDGRVGRFLGEWNSLDGAGYKSARDPAIKLLHYTNIPTQPNHKHARVRLQTERKKHWFGGPDVPHPLPGMNALFDEMLAAAIKAGYKPKNYRMKTEFGSYGRGKSDRHHGSKKVA